MWKMVGDRVEGQSFENRDLLSDVNFRQFLTWLSNICLIQFARTSRQLSTRRERPKSTPYLRLKNIQGTTIGNIWKSFFKKSHNAEKLKKRPFRLIKRFYKPKTSNKCKGVPFDRIRKFSRKSRIVPKKPFGLASTFGSIKKFVV